MFSQCTRQRVSQTVLVKHSAKLLTDSRLANNARPNVLSKKKISPAVQYPEMVAADVDYDSEEAEQSIAPIVEELTRIKERVMEVWQVSYNLWC